MSIDFDVTDGIAIITINRPERMNAMDAEHYKGLSQAWMRVRDETAIRVAIGMELRLTGVALNAATALNYGLINKVVPQETLMETARDYAKRIAANAPLAVQADKEMAVRSREMDRTTGLRVEALTNRLLQF